MQVGILAALLRPHFVDRAAIASEKRTWLAAHSPAHAFTAFLRFVVLIQIPLVELANGRAQARGESLGVGIGQPDFQLLAAIGAGGAIHVRPHPIRGGADQTIQLFARQPILELEKLAQTVVAVFRTLGQVAHIAGIRFHFLHS